MGKDKLVITIKNDDVMVEHKGDIDKIIIGAMTWITDYSIKVGITKKEFLNFCKKVYEGQMQEISKEN